jgi:single-stranded-DNA-specific exonuclease
MYWQIKNKSKIKDLQDLEKVLLENRSIKDLKSFFEPKNSEDLEFGMWDVDNKELKKAVTRIKTAIKKQEKVVIFGDYDADGICATAILWQGLNELGLVTTPFLPSREKHGYGLSVKALEEIIKKNKPDLVITVDNGIVAFKAAEFLKEENIDLIITDHHRSEEKKPTANALVVSSKICGAAVAWVLLKELDKTQAKEQLDLVALATIADLMPLKGVNRSLVFHGLRSLNNTKRYGLLELIKTLKYRSKQLDSYSVGFGLAPRINAMGRLGNAMESLRLLCTKSSQRAKELASLLGQTNQQRQDLTQDLLKHAERQYLDFKDNNIILVHSDHYHEGVIGLIAGRLTEKFNKPSIAISTTGETSKASARSVLGIDIIKFIREIKGDLLEAGGHPMAAGFGFETKKLELIKNKLIKLASDFDSKLLKPSLDIDCVLAHDLLNLKIIKLISKFEPFGQGNRKPLLALEDLVVGNIKTMGKESEHLKLGFRMLDVGCSVEGVGWRMGDLASKIKAGDSINIAGYLDINEWNGQKKLQVVIKDVKLAS